MVENDELGTGLHVDEGKVFDEMRRSRESPNIPISDGFVPSLIPSLNFIVLLNP